jgi:hypothetical protein
MAVDATTRSVQNEAAPVEVLRAPRAVLRLRARLPSAGRLVAQPRNGGPHREERLVAQPRNGGPHREERLVEQLPSGECRPRGVCRGVVGLVRDGLATEAVTLDLVLAVPTRLRRGAGPLPGLPVPADRPVTRVLTRVNPRRPSGVARDPRPAGRPTDTNAMSGQAVAGRRLDAVADQRASSSDYLGVSVPFELNVRNSLRQGRPSRRFLPVPMWVCWTVRSGLS